jgi:hypothetical protein
MRRLIFILALLFAGLSAAQAQSLPQPRFSQAELDRLLAPVALYPDALLSQLLMAATYPEEVAEASSWSRANPGVSGDAAVQAVERFDWDPSVKSLVAFPQLLQRMEENPDWTRALGEAFLEQQPHVMETVQQLRRRAQAAGTLQSDAQLHVENQGQTTIISPAAPQLVYVPYYDPLVVYGNWWWPAYPPVRWSPWNGYARIYQPGVSFSFWWGPPVAVSTRFFFGGFDWHRHQARVVHHHHHYHRLPTGRWQHDLARLRAQRVASATANAAAANAATARILREQQAGSQVGRPAQLQAPVGAPAPLAPTVGAPARLQTPVGAPAPLQPKVSAPQRFERERRAVAPERVQPRVGAPQVLEQRVGAPAQFQPKVGAPPLLEQRVGAPDRFQPKVGAPPQVAAPRESRPAPAQRESRPAPAQRAQAQREEIRERREERQEHRQAQRQEHRQEHRPRPAQRQEHRNTPSRRPGERG